MVTPPSGYFPARVRVVANPARPGRCPIWPEARPLFVAERYVGTVALFFHDDAWLDEARTQIDLLIRPLRPKDFRRTMRAGDTFVLKDGDRPLADGELLPS